MLSLTIMISWVGFALSMYFAPVGALIDSFRRHDYGGWPKAGWALVIIVIPLVGGLIYFGHSSD